MKLFRRRTCLLMAGAALCLSGAARAQESLNLYGQEMKLRWNEPNTGFGLNPTVPNGPGVESNQMPAISVTLTSTEINGVSGSGTAVSPDLQWYFPLDIEGVTVADTSNPLYPGLLSPLGYTLGTVQSSPTVASVQSSSPVMDNFLAVMFGSETAVNRTISNPLGFPNSNYTDPATGKPAYSASDDPYAYLNGRDTGCAYSVEAFGGTTEDNSSSATAPRTAQPFWWWGVRNLPWYANRTGDVSATTGTAVDESAYNSTPSKAVSDFFLNVSDSLVRAFDYDPQSDLDVLPTPPTDSATLQEVNVAAAMYLQPDVHSTEVDGLIPPPGAVQGAGPVSGLRSDVPLRTNDRVYNLNLTGASFGLATRSLNAALTNHYRVPGGMGPVRSTGAFVRLPAPITYNTPYYAIAPVPTASTDTRRDPKNIVTTDSTTTDELYVVGGDDGYIYAFDANPANARKIIDPTAATGGPTRTTYAGRLVWTFRAALRAPIYTNNTSNGSEIVPLTALQYAAGENPGDALKTGGSSPIYQHYSPTTGQYSQNAADPLVAPDAPIITGPVTSSPTVAVDQQSGIPYIYVGSSIGRLFCLDARYGTEKWEFKTTPIGRTILYVGNGAQTVTVDSVQGAPITTTPALGWVHNVASLANSAAGDRLVCFFGANDGKVYAVDARDGSPIGPSQTSGWTATGDNTVGVAGSDTWSRMDHFGFVTYAFQVKDSAGNPVDVGDTRIDGTYGRLVPATSHAVSASVVLRPTSEAGPADANGHQIPFVDGVFISSETNLQDKTSQSGDTGGTIFCVKPTDGTVLWTFDRWRDLRISAGNDHFDTGAATDQIVRPGPFRVAPAYATDISVYDDKLQTAGDVTAPIANALFAVDASGHLFAIRTDDGTLTDKTTRAYWRIPYLLSGYTAGADGGVYSSPVVSTPVESVSSTGATSPGDIAGHSYVWIGDGQGLVAIDVTSARGIDYQSTGTGEPAPVNDKDVALTPPNVGGTKAWSYATSTASLSTTTTDDTTDAIAEPVFSTAAIYAGYVYAGSNNGLMYAWSSQAGLVGDDYHFNNGGPTGATGRGPFTGANTPRVPLPTNLLPPGGASATGDFYVDVFAAGFGGSADPYGLSGGQPFTKSQFDTLNPTGETPNPSPQPLAATHNEFVSPQGAILEWGDPIGAIAWGPDIDAAASANAGVNDPTLQTNVDFRITGLLTSASLRANVPPGSTGDARQLFYMNPFGQTVPDSLTEGSSTYFVTHPITAVHAGLKNPMAGNSLSPGPKGAPWTITGELQSNTVINTKNADGTTTTRSQRVIKTPKNSGNQARWHLANPINIQGYITGGSITSLVDPGVTATNYTAAPATTGYLDYDRNGNANVPVAQVVVGDHGTNTQPTTGLLVQDRSHLPLLRSASAIGNPLGGASSDIYLRLKVQPAKLRYIGGPRSTYKPLFYMSDRSQFPNTWPLTTPPEPYGQPGLWQPQLASSPLTNSTAVTAIGVEVPPFGQGEENLSPDYPDIDASIQSWVKPKDGIQLTETDMTHTDGYVAAGGNSAAAAATGGSAQGGTPIGLRVAVPRYQPANFTPSGGDPTGAAHGPGYYTINPTNSTGWTAALLGWQPNAPVSKASSYLATSSTTLDSSVYYYFGILGAHLPPTASLVQQEPTYLTQVYADTNGNGQADSSLGEAYRMFVSGTEIRPTESMRVETATVEIPRSPETAIPAGYIPFPYYWAGQNSGNSQAEDPFVFGERNLYAPFAVYNDGNVNLWNLRMDKFDQFAGHLFAPETDPNFYAGADAYSNWPGSGMLRRTNLASTLDALPVSLGQPGAADDRTLFTPVQKARPATLDDGKGRLITVKDVFPFSTAGTDAYAPRQSVVGLPYLTVAVPPGTPPGRYSTPSGRLVLFEDDGDGYNINGTPSYDGVLNSVNGASESGSSSSTVVSVTVGETRLTSKVTSLAPSLPMVDPGIAYASTRNETRPNSNAELAAIWQNLAQDASPSAYRDPVTGDLATFWSSNRVQVGSDPIPNLPTTNNPGQTYRIFGSAMHWADPNGQLPIQAGQDTDQFIGGVLGKDPWGWQYQGGSPRNSFWSPDFLSGKWFGDAVADPFMPSQTTVNRALGAPTSSPIDPKTVSFTSPSPITDFHGLTDVPGMVFYTGQIGVGSEQRSAIFYVPVKTNTDGSVSRLSEPQAIGVGDTKVTLDPSQPKYQPRPFLITSGGDFSDNGYLTGEKLLALGVAWFGGAPGRWSLYISTIKAESIDSNGVVSDPSQWSTVQLTLPQGVASALHPSVYYHQADLHNGTTPVRMGILETAFSGYSRAGRNPDIYVARYIAMQLDKTGTPALGNWQALGYARRGSPFDVTADKRPLDPLQRVTGDPRPIYRSHWASWYGRNSLRPVVYWFRKPVNSNSNDFELAATFQPRIPGNTGANTGYVVETSSGDATGAAFDSTNPMSKVSAYFDLAAGTVRFTTSDPVNAPAPLSRTYQYNGVATQDFIYASMNPYALRVTLDNDQSDTQPQVWLDESHEIVGDPYRVGTDELNVSPADPGTFRRDRLWVVWRRSSAPEGTTRASALFYQTYRLAVDTGAPINEGTGTTNDPTQASRVTVKAATGGWTPGPYTVSPQTGRIFFTEADDGNQVEIITSGRDVNNNNATTSSDQTYTVGWQAEDPPAPITYATGGGYRLPLGQWDNPRTVPMIATGNDSQPFLFKDPFSDQGPPGLQGVPAEQTSDYYTRGNNNMWLFWASTRPSRTIGNTVGAPQSPATVAPLNPDPYYYNTFGGQLKDGNGNPVAALAYAGSASDVYFTTLSPDFRQ